MNADLSEIIAENFGANATYVEGLLNRFRSDPALVDESWRAYFEELLGEEQIVSAATTDAAGNGQATTREASGDGASAAQAATITQAPTPQKQTAPPPQNAAAPPRHEQPTQPPQHRVLQASQTPKAPPQGGGIPIRGGAP